MKKRIDPGYLISLLLSVVLAFVIGAVILAIAGFSPGKAYLAMLNGAFSSARHIGDLLEYAMVLCLCGLACVLGARVGIFNVGGEGQLLLGAIAACQVGVWLDGLTPWLVLPLAALAAMAAGGLYALIPGVLKVKVKVNEVITTIMLNTVAASFCQYLAKGPWKNANKNMVAATEQLNARYWFGGLIGGSNLSTAILAAAVLALGLLAGCAAPLPAPSAPVRDVAGDLVPENDEQAAVLAGKLDRTGQRLHSWKELAPALRASRAHIAGREPGQVAVAHGDVAVTWGDVAKTLDRLEALLPRLDAEPGLLAERFRWVKLKDGAAFSGYYEPVVKASRTRKPGYTAPLYRVPPDLRELNLGSFKSELIGQRVVYRMEKGKPVPYYTRAEIDGLDGRPGVLRGKGLDAVMNYPFRTAALGWLTGGNAADFRGTMETIRENYPPAAFYEVGGAKRS